MDAFVEREILPAFAASGYQVIDRAATEVSLAGRRRPRWAVALAVFLFPVGLVLLLVRRPASTRLLWKGDSPELEVRSSDPRSYHLVAEFAAERERPPGFVDTVAAPFAAGATPVLITWVVAVQFVDSRTLFVAAIAIAVAFGCGLGTLIGLRRGSRSSDPRNPIAWATLPALAGALTVVAAFVALILFLLAIGAGD
ncbi:MAG: hypothetical protein WDZ37_01095 [Solirubrobacterales bacterium]